MRRRSLTFVVDENGETVFTSPDISPAIRWIMEKDERAALWQDDLGALLLRFEHGPE